MSVAFCLSEHAFLFSWTLKFLSALKNFCNQCCTIWSQVELSPYALLILAAVWEALRPRMLRAILNKSWRQHPTKQQLYGHLPPITKTIKVRQTRHAGHCWRSRDKLISDVLLWTPSHGWAKAGWPAWTYIQQLCEDTGCSTEDLPEAMNDREEWRERDRDICAGGTTRWIWWRPSLKWPQTVNLLFLFQVHHQNQTL